MIDGLRPRPFQRGGVRLALLVSLAPAALALPQRPGGSFDYDYDDIGYDETGYDPGEVIAALVHADVNGDGRPDVVSGGTGDAKVHYSVDTLKYAEKRLVDESFVDLAVLADGGAAGADDLLVANASGTVERWSLDVTDDDPFAPGLTSSTFAAQPSGSAIAVAVGDEPVGGVLAGAVASGSEVVFFDIASGTVTAYAQTLSVSGVTDLLVGDFDGTGGDDEVAVAHAAGVDVYSLDLSNDTVDPTPLYSVAPGANPGLRITRVRDTTADLDVLVVARSEANRWRIVCATGSGQDPTVKGPPVLASLAAGDIDLDGEDDLCVVAGDGTIFGLFGNGETGHTNARFSSTDSNWISQLWPGSMTLTAGPALTLGDADNDGDLDVVAARWAPPDSGYAMLYLRNANICATSVGPVINRAIKLECVAHEGGNHTVQMTFEFDPGPSPYVLRVNAVCEDAVTPDQLDPESWTEQTIPMSTSTEQLMVEIEVGAGIAEIFVLVQTYELAGGAIVDPTPVNIYRVELEQGSGFGGQTTCPRPIVFWGQVVCENGNFTGAETGGIGPAPRPPRVPRAPIQ